MKLVKLMAVAAVAMITVATMSPSEAREGKTKTTKSIQRVIRDVTPLFAGTIQVSARRHVARGHRTGKHHARGGSCDGFQRCRCGTTAARHFGLPYDYNGMNLKMANSYYAFPHTSFRIGVAGVLPHHVLAITGGSDCRTAMVHDDAGDYQRNVCNMTFVVPGGGTGGFKQTASAHGRQLRHERYAANYVSSNYMDRFGAGM